VRVDVAPTPAALRPETLAGATALVVDVLRASTSIVSAMANGCAAVVPVGDAQEARRRAAATAGALLAGERRGEPLEGFDLGNSPLEFSAERVGGRTVFLTTSNGTGALLAVRGAAAIGVAAFVNLSAVSQWAMAAGRDVIVACSGERGDRSLEDEVCAGLLVDRLLAAGAATAGAEAEEAARRARPYAGDLARLAQDSRWARHLAAHGRARDVEACLAIDTFALVPVYRPDVDKVVSPYR
jgi:2-phosphosulfolactate phosphatase